MFTIRISSKTVLGFLILFTIGCATESARRTTSPGEPEPTIFSTLPGENASALEGTDDKIARPVPATYHFTYHQPDGNRLVAGLGSIQNAQSFDIPLAGEPRWLVAGPYRDGSLWVAVLDDGQVQAFYVDGESVESFPINPPLLPLGTPPVLKILGAEATLVMNPASGFSTLTHPSPVSTTEDAVALVSSDGALVLWDGNEIDRLQVNALMDGRILADGEGSLLFLSKPTNRYAHGVLGDDLEAGGITLVKTYPAFGVVTEIVVDAPGVIEGISPIWSDLNGDGNREIIVTQSDSQGGAKIFIYNQEGLLLASGPPIGQGFRWRHQLVVAPFGPESHLELAVVRTPHIGGVVEFYRMVGGQLKIIAQVPGFSTHTIGSRNLDNALAGDFDGDGHIELLVPDQRHETLAAIRRTRDGAEVVWLLPLGGQQTANIAAVTFPHGEIAVGVGTDKNVLRIWMP